MIYFETFILTIWFKNAKLNIKKKKKKKATQVFQKFLSVGKGQTKRLFLLCFVLFCFVLFCLFFCFVLFCFFIGLMQFAKFTHIAPGGPQYFEMSHVLPKRSPLFKPALTRWPLGLCVATHRPPILCYSKTPNFWFVTQRPPISDFVTQRPPISDFVTPKPVIVIIWPKLTVWLVTIITETRILRDL